MNIIDTLKNSKYGKLHTLVSENNQETLKDYKLPKIILVGHGSVGKSSLLENILGSKLFPRGNGSCTRMPIHVILKNGPPMYKIKPYETTYDSKNSLYLKIEEIMNSMVKKIISEDEIVVEITDMDMPNLELYDLPGILAYPEEDAKLTTGIVTKYLTLYPDSIVLCVVPAVTPRLTSCKSVALIKEAGLEENCILVLTMVDRLQEETINDFLIDRLIGKSDELRSFNFSGIVGIINRFHTDKKSLSENNSYEKSWLDKNILDVLSTEYADYRVTISNSVTLPCLLKQIDELCNKSIDTKWKPKIVAQLNADKSSLQERILKMGSEICGCEIASYYFESVKLCMTTDVKKKCEFYLPIPMEDKWTEGFIPNTKQSLEIKKIVPDLVNKIINNSYKSVREIRGCNFLLGHNIVRFPKIHLDVLEAFSIHDNKIRNSYVNQFCDIINSYINNCIMVNHKITEDHITSCIRGLAELYLIDLENCEMIPDEKYFEDTKYSLQREALHDKITVLDNYLDSITKI